MHIQSKWVKFRIFRILQNYPPPCISEMTESECKLEFLKFLQQQETFGSTFFVVNQKTVNYYPDILLIAINRHGFHILDSVKKVT